MKKSSNAKPKSKSPKKVKWSAVYLVDCKESEDPTKHGFDTREEAIKYSRQFYCKGCRNEAARALWWKHRFGINVYEAIREIEKLATKNKDHALEYALRQVFGDSFSSCACEWVFPETDKAMKAESFGDLMGAIGAKKI